MGFKMSLKAGVAHLREYLNRAVPERRALGVASTGWAEDRFVLPDQVFGRDADLVFYRTDDPAPSPYTVAGTLEGWRDEVAKPLEPYDVPVFGISCGFAGPLMRPLDIPSGGFHLQDPTSTGKTSACLCGLSPWGDPKALAHTWLGTRVGFETTAAAHSDGLLVLDEIGQADPREVGDIIYLLFNDAGKMRGNVCLTYRRSLRWRLLVLSSGEKSLAQIMEAGGQKPMAGQELRIAHVRVDSGDGCGIFTGLADPKARLELLTRVDAASRQHHGTAIREYLAWLTDPERLLQVQTARHHVERLMQEWVGQDTGEVQRAAPRFALVGYAGELATEAGITGWAAGRALAAAGAVYKRWRADWGDGKRDETNFLAHAEEWLAANSMGHFAEVDSNTRLMTDDSSARRALLKPFCGYTTIEGVSDSTI